MHMNWIESLIYGFISGLSEFLPFSSKAHQELAMLLFGTSQNDPVRDFLIHIALIFAMYYAYMPIFQRTGRASGSAYQYITRRQVDIRFIKGATLPMLISLIVLLYVSSNINYNLLISSVIFLINGVILYIPGRMLQGNKDARTMTQLDSILFGLLGGLGAVTGISRVGCQTSYAISRGSDRQHALNWAYSLSIPALILLSLFDVIQIFTAGSIPFWTSFFSYILSAASSFLGGYIAVKLSQIIMVRVGFFGIAYYNWGIALLTFLLYLFAV